MPAQIRFSKANFLSLVAWFPDIDDGILDTQDVLDACDGHRETGEIRVKVAALSNLGIDSFQAASADEWTYDEVLANALADQIQEDCVNDDISVVHELIEGLLKGGDARALIENSLRESTLEALRL